LFSQTFINLTFDTMGKITLCYKTINPFDFHILLFNIPKIKSHILVVSNKIIHISSISDFIFGNFLQNFNFKNLISMHAKDIS